MFLIIYYNNGTGIGEKYSKCNRNSFYYFSIPLL